MSCLSIILFWGIFVNGVHGDICVVITKSHQFMLAYKKYKYRCQLSKDHMGWSSCGSLKLWRLFQ